MIYTCTSRVQPDYVIKSAADLHTIIAQHHPRGGMPIRLLRESWPLVGPAIEELEREGKVMVTRTGNGNVGGGAGGHGQGGAGEGGTMKTVFLDPIGKIAGLDQGRLRSHPLLHSFSSFYPPSLLACQLDRYSRTDRFSFGRIQGHVGWTDNACC